MPTISLATYGKLFSEFFIVCALLGIKSRAYTIGRSQPQGCSLQDHQQVASVSSASSTSHTYLNTKLLKAAPTDPVRKNNSRQSNFRHFIE